MARPLLGLMLALALVSCDKKALQVDSDAVDQEPDEKDPTDGPTDTDPGDTDTDPDADADIVRFIAMGDGGEGNPDQYAVSQAVETICARDGCEFVLYLGDNFYDNGVDGVNDDQFRTKFEEPYANLPNSMPFFVVLGNHDFGEIPVNYSKTDFQIAYSSQSAKWTMPDHFYSFERKHAKFYALDTNDLMLGLGWWSGNPGNWIDTEIANTNATWKIAFGHHPYISNGKHGNAGNYEGLGFIPWIADTVNGNIIKDWMKDHLCGEVDLYINGHDHNRQWLEPRCGTEFIVSGAAAKTTDMEHRDNNPTLWDDDTTEGFAWIELRDNVMTVVFYDKNGNEDYRGVVTK